MSKITVAFTLDTEKDKRIMRWLESLDKGDKSRQIRDALNAYLGKGGVSLGDVYEALQRLDRKLSSGLVMAQPADPGAEVDIPTDILENLDNLGL